YRDHRALHLFPYTTLFRSLRGVGLGEAGDALEVVAARAPVVVLDSAVAQHQRGLGWLEELRGEGAARAAGLPESFEALGEGERRSEEHTSELQSLRHLVCR